MWAVDKKVLSLCSMFRLPKFPQSHGHHVALDMSLGVNEAESALVGKLITSA